MKKLIYLEDAIALAQSIEDEYDARSAKVDYTSQTFSEEIQCSLANPAKETAKKWGHIADGAEKVKEALKNLPSAEPEQRWIPVSKRLPDEGERVLCTHTGGLNPNRQVIEHIYQNGKFTLGWDMDMNPSSPTFGQRYMGDVIAWMPLPEPYREDGEAE